LGTFVSSAVEPLLTGDLRRQGNAGQTGTRFTARRQTMSKRELIDAIRIHNRTVSPDFLARFNEDDLKAYLERIRETRPMPPQVRMGVTVPSKQVLMLA
jgi:hypothetical protein